MIVGGLIGLLGGIAGPPLTHFLNRRARRTKVREEKLEELVRTVYAFDHWLEMKRNSTVFGDRSPETSTPIAIARAITTVHLTEFDSDLSELEKVARNYEIWMLGAARKRLAGEESRQVVEGFETVIEPYQVKLHAFLQSLKDRRPLTN